MNMRKDSDESSVEDEVEDEDEQMMNISETRKCYVYGQCQVSRTVPLLTQVKNNEPSTPFQEYSLDFKDTEDPEGCHKFCGKNKECNWWSWEPAFKLCILYSNCTEKGVDPPNVEACGDCISGEKL